MAKLKILSAGAVKSGVAQLAQSFGRERGTEVEVEFTTAPEVRRRAGEGESVDVIIAPPIVMDELARSSKIFTDSRSLLGRSRIGVVVHKESNVSEFPDVESFKRVLLSASSIVRNRASSGAYAAKLLQELCPATELGSRVVVVESGAAVMEYVAAHAPAAIGLAQISEIRVVLAKGLPIRFAGPLPDAVQNVTSYEAAAASGSAGVKSARELAAYMATPQAKAVFAATGID